MRKDVKLGFAIGGVLLAVLVVYVLVISGGSDSPANNDVSLVTADPSGETVKPSLPPDKADKTPAAPKHATEEKASDLTLGDAAKQMLSSSPPKATDPFKATTSDNNSKTDAVAKGTPNSTASGSVDVWGSALQEGKLVAPVMMTEQPVPGREKSVPPVPAEANKPAVGATGTGPGVSNTPASVPQSSISAPSFTSTPPSTRPAGTPVGSTSTVGTHKVEVGESFATISKDVYGSSIYFAHLIRANPTLDPRKLKPGMVINVPPASEVRADKATAQTAGATTPPSVADSKLDEKTEYRVVSGDSLHRIATKLYGNEKNADKIYELNKTTIGADPAKLKLGMVLKLPEAPTSR